MRVPLLDLKPQYEQIRAEVEPVLLAICQSQMFILGPKVQEGEAAVAAYCGAAHGVGMVRATRSSRRRTRFSRRWGRLRGWERSRYSWTSIRRRSTWTGRSWKAR